MNLSVKILMLLIPFYVLYAIGDILSSGIRGSGQTIAPTVITLITCCLLKYYGCVCSKRYTKHIKYYRNIPNNMDIKLYCIHNILYILQK